MVYHNVDFIPNVNIAYTLVWYIYTHPEVNPSSIYHITLCTQKPKSNEIKMSIKAPRLLIINPGNAKTLVVLRSHMSLECSVICKIIYSKHCALAPHPLSFDRRAQIPPFHQYAFVTGRHISDCNLQFHLQALQSQCGVSQSKELDHTRNLGNW